MFLLKFEFEFEFDFEFELDFDGLFVPLSLSVFVPVECLGPWEVREWTLRHLRLLAPHKKPNHTTPSCT